MIENVTYNTMYSCAIEIRDELKLKGLDESYLLRAFNKAMVLLFDESPAVYSELVYIVNYDEKLKLGNLKVLLRFSNKNIGVLMIFNTVNEFKNISIELVYADTQQPVMSIVKGKMSKIQIHVE